MPKLTRTMKQEMSRRFAYGESIERVAGEMQIDAQRVKHRYVQYLALPIGEKLSITLLPELITNRAHRLADDIKDIERIDALLSAADEKTLVSLLDMKRKIKERMMKDLAGATPSTDDAELEREIAEGYERVFGAAEAG